MGDPVEAHAIANVVEQLVERYPTVSRERIEEIIAEETARTADAKVREYVPSLIEHAADERLREEAHPVDRTDSGGGGPVIVANDADHLDPIEVEQRSRNTGLLFGDLGGGSD
ncbi:hypothetical protein ET445_01675 [Agromyces protaetiae]|uniref:Uncharacterized protein n=1 Tax=Agromyces protaetiae TaxID=2509455 RepID=A0A4P6FP22_9MICO|nr:hypothetical protein [Agromyces protaetiae]QAY72238.1 hypothetical protein ET445_01675 [Agromyces protaetiae]